MGLLSGGAFVHAPYYLADAFSIIPNNYIYIYIYIYVYIYIYITDMVTGQQQQQWAKKLNRWEQHPHF